MLKPTFQTFNEGTKFPATPCCKFRASLEAETFENSGSHPLNPVIVSRLFPDTNILRFLMPAF